MFKFSGTPVEFDCTHICKKKFDEQLESLVDMNTTLLNQWHNLIQKKKFITNLNCLHNLKKKKASSLFNNEFLNTEHFLCQIF